MGFDFAKIHCIKQEEKADEDGRAMEVRTNVFSPVTHGCFRPPDMPPHPTGSPLPTERWGGGLSKEPGGPNGHQASKVFADRNDELLINNAFVA